MIERRATPRASSRERKSWLVRVVERLRVRRIVISLVVLALVADAFLALSLWAASSSTPVDAGPTLEPWPAAGLPPVPEPTSPSPATPQGAATVVAKTPTPPRLPTPEPTPSPLPLAPGDMNLLLLGTDQRHGADRSWRTDTIIVVAIRPGLGLVAMMSIPRDLWVTIPGYGQNRINVVDYMGERAQGRGGGPRLLAATLQQNLGIPIHSYARVNFDGLVKIIDALGGVTVTVERPFNEIIDDADGSPQIPLRLQPGVHHLDGITALAYCRSRHGSSDMDRSRRQQQVLLAMRNAAMRPEVLPRLPALVSALSGTVETDLQPSQVLSLLKMALQFKPEAFRRQVFDYTMVRDWTTPTGAQVLLPNRTRISQVWAQLTSK